MQRARPEAPSDGSRTLTATPTSPSDDANAAAAGPSNPVVGVLRLRGLGPRNGPRVVWKEDVIDNEHMDKKSSKSELPHTPCRLLALPRSLVLSSSKFAASTTSQKPSTNPLATIHPAADQAAMKRKPSTHPRHLRIQLRLQKAVRASTVTHIHTRRSEGEGGSSGPTALPRPLSLSRLKHTHMSTRMSISLHRLRLR